MLNITSNPDQVSLLLIPEKSGAITHDHPQSHQQPSDQNIC